MRVFICGIGPGDVYRTASDVDWVVDYSYMNPYPGYYLTGDGGYLEKDGYVFVMGRVDDVLNVAGHRLSTGGMEEVLAKHPDVAECAVVGVADDLKGQVSVGIIVLKSGVTRSQEEIVTEIIQTVRKEISPVASFKEAMVVKRLPKTRSGKILRGTMRKIADRENVSVPSTIDDPAILMKLRIPSRPMGTKGSRDND